MSGNELEAKIALARSRAHALGSNNRSVKVLKSFQGASSPPALTGLSPQLYHPMIQTLPGCF